MTVVTRFAPAPTGFLHFGNARTALFNWLFAKHNNGTYLLRVEDTDRTRSTPEAIDAIFDGLDWLGIKSDAPAVFQSENAPQHKEVAEKLLASGKAYFCQCTPEQLDQDRQESRKAGLPSGYNRRCREQNHAQGVVRLKIPLNGKTEIDDMIQGQVTVDNRQLDDFILLRSDGTPTYMLSAVVDDHDMGITHIIRGDDHLTNAFRQSHLYAAMAWTLPIFGHLPLIHGEDGAKFSKRHGAPSLSSYKDLGYLSEALCNYLVRLGWSHGDDEFISQEQAIEWFTPQNIQKSPARFDWKKLNHMNAHYLRALTNDKLCALLAPFVEQKIERTLTSDETTLLTAALPGLKQRAETLVGLADNALFYLNYPTEISPKGLKFLTEENIARVAAFVKKLEAQEIWTEEALEEMARGFAVDQDVSLGKVAQPLRVLLTGTTVSPSIFEIFSVFGKEKSIERLMNTQKLLQ